MGLNIVIGALAGTIGVGDEGEEMLRQDFSQINVADLNREPREDSPFGIERVVWLHLYEAARLSLKLGTAIRFSRERISLAARSVRRASAKSTTTG